MTNPEQKNQIYFHLGLAKAASTFLQRQLFPAFSGITFMPKKRFSKHRDQAFVNQHSNILFTFEFHKYLPKKLIEISKLYPDAKIILVFREQSSWLESKYRYHIRKHGRENFKEFFDLDDDQGVIRQKEVQYQLIIETVYQYFNQPPLLINYHDLRQNPNNFFPPLYQYLSINPPELKKKRVLNSAFNDKQIRYLLSLNRAYPYAPLNSPSKIRNKIHYKYREFLLHTWAFIARFLPAKSSGIPIISEEIKHRIQEHYREDWEYCMTEIQASISSSNA